MRDYAIHDLNGYQLVFGHYIYTVGPPVPIERVDVPVRLEKRLAGLLEDLAKHKRMSVSGCRISRRSTASITIATRVIVSSKSDHGALPP